MTDSIANQLELLQLIAAQNTQSTVDIVDSIAALQTESVSERASLKTELETLIDTKTDQLTTANTNLSNLLTAFENATESDFTSVNDLITQNANIIAANQSLITQLQNTDTVTNDTISDLQNKDAALEASITSLNTSLTNAINAVDAKVDQEVIDRTAAVSALNDIVVANKSSADASFSAIEARATSIEADLNGATLVALKSAYNTGVQSVDADGTKAITIGGVEHVFNFSIN